MAIHYGFYYSEGLCYSNPEQQRELPPDDRYSKLYRDLVGIRDIAKGWKEQTPYHSDKEAHKRYENFMYLSEAYLCLLLNREKIKNGALRVLAGVKQLDNAEQSADPGCEIITVVDQLCENKTKHFSVPKDWRKYFFKKEDPTLKVVFRSMGDVSTHLEIYNYETKTLELLTPDESFDKVMEKEAYPLVFHWKILMNTGGHDLVKKALEDVDLDFGNGLCTEARIAGLSKAAEECLGHPTLGKIFFDHIKTLSPAEQVVYEHYLPLLYTYNNRKVRKDGTGETVTFDEELFHSYLLELDLGLEGMPTVPSQGDEASGGSDFLGRSLSMDDGSLGVAPAQQAQGTNESVVIPFRVDFKKGNRIVPPEEQVEELLDACLKLHHSAGVPEIGVTYSANYRQTDDVKQCEARGDRRLARIKGLNQAQMMSCLKDALEKDLRYKSLQGRIYICCITTIPKHENQRDHVRRLREDVDAIEAKLRDKPGFALLALQNQGTAGTNNPFAVAGGVQQRLGQPEKDTIQGGLTDLLRRYPPSQRMLDLLNVPLAEVQRIMGLSHFRAAPPVAQPTGQQFFSPGNATEQAVPAAQPLLRPPVVAPVRAAPPVAQPTGQQFFPPGNATEQAVQQPRQRRVLVRRSADDVDNDRYLRTAVINNTQDLQTLASFINEQLARIISDDASSDKALYLRQLLNDIGELQCRLIQVKPDEIKMIARRCALVAHHRRRVAMDTLFQILSFGCAGLGSSKSWKAWENLEFASPELRKVHAATLQGKAGRAVTLGDVTADDFSQYRNIANRF